MNGLNIFFFESIKDLKIMDLIISMTSIDAELELIDNYHPYS